MYWQADIYTHNKATMTPETPTYTPAEKDALQGLQGQELARQQIEIANQQANTVRDIRTNIHNILQDTEQTADAEAIAVLQEHEDAVEDMTDGYDAVQIEDFSGGKLGDNIVGTTCRPDRRGAAP